MELIVLSSPDDIQNEARQINELFDAGMKLFQVRKPDSSIEKIHSLLVDIDPRHRHEVVLHQHHEIAAAFGLKRRHFPEAIRVSQADALDNLQRTGLALSTSIHSLNDLEDLRAFEYAFFGPVFNSISKFGYNANLPAGFCLPARAARPAIIALGGIDQCNIQQAKSMYFDGVAVLGAIWNRGDSPVANFLGIRDCICNLSDAPIQTLKHD